MSGCNASAGRVASTSWNLMMLGWTSFLWLTISRSVFLLSPPPCVRGTHLAATKSLVFLFFISFIVPFLPVPSWPTTW